MWEAIRLFKVSFHLKSEETYLHQDKIDKNRTKFVHTLEGPQHQYSLGIFHHHYLQSLVHQPNKTVR